jgi:hypothetical protein
MKISKADIWVPCGHRMSANGSAIKQYLRGGKRAPDPTYHLAHYNIPRRGARFLLRGNKKMEEDKRERINFYWSVKLDLYLLYKFFPDMTPSEAILMYFLRDFYFSKSPKIKRITRNGKEYVWITYNYIIKKLPILQIKTKAGMKKLMDKLFKRNIFEYIVENGKLFICPTPKLYFFTPPKMLWNL